MYEPAGWLFHLSELAGVAGQSRVHLVRHIQLVPAVPIPRAGKASRTADAVTESRSIAMA
jgi:hypothetical protein